MKEDEVEAAYNTFLMVMDNGQLIDTMLTTGSIKSTTASQKDALLAPQTVIITQQQQNNAVYFGAGSLIGFVITTVAISFMFRPKLSVERNE